MSKDNCRNEHPRDKGKGFASQNRFSSFQSPQGARSTNAGKDDWRIIESDIKEDLTAGKGLPKWIFTSYGPHKNSPASLLPDNELSPEELRLRFYNNAATTSPDQANNEAIQAYVKCESDIKEVLSNLGRIKSHHEQREKEHPNRYDFCKIDGKKNIEQVTEELKTGGGGFRQPTSGLGQRSQPSTFGQPSQAIPGFGKTAFGQSTASTGFGQPSLGQTSNGQSSFGKPAFGQPAQSSSGFGQPNPFKTGFGQPSQPNSAFGQPSQPANSFGQANQSTTNQQGGVFGKPAASGFGQSSVGQPAFGQPAQPTTTFGTPAPGFSQPPNAFGQPSKPQTGPSFGSTAQASTGGFGAPSFGQPASTGSFGQQAPASNTFGQPASNNTMTGSTSFGQQPPQALSAFRNPSQSTATASTSSNPTITPSRVGNSSSASPHPLTGAPPAIIHPSQALPAITPQNTTYATGPNNTRRLTKWRGRPVSYDEDSKPYYERTDSSKGVQQVSERIWFPEGKDSPGVAAITAKKEEMEGEEGAYTEEVVGAYRYLFERGEFDPQRAVPRVPPRREWLGADF